MIMRTKILTGSVEFDLILTWCIIWLNQRMKNSHSCTVISVKPPEYWVYLCLSSQAEMVPRNCPCSPWLLLHHQTPEGPWVQRSQVQSALGKVRSPLLSLPRSPWKGDSKSQPASSRCLVWGEDPGTCSGGSASQVLISLLSSLE